MALGEAIRPVPKEKRKRKKNHSRRNKTVSRRKMVLALDADARARVFERDGGLCIRCRVPRPVQWAHVLSRRHISLRWDSDNGMTLCAGCHLFWHHEPAVAIDWFRKNYPDRYERLLAAFHVVGQQKVNVKELYEQLSGTAAR